MKINKTIICALLAISVLPLTSCRNRQSQQRFFVLKLNEPQPLSHASSDWIVSVPDFRISNIYNTTNLIYLISPGRFEYDYYKRFAVGVDTQITELTKDRLAQTGMFKSILNPGSAVIPTHILEGNIKEIYADFSSKNPPQKPSVKISINFKLISQSRQKNTIIFEKKYSQKVPIDESTAEKLLESYNTALTAILNDLESDISLLIK